MEKKEKKIEEKDRVEMKVEETVKGELKADAKGKKKRKPLSKKAKIALWCSIASFAIIAVLLPVLLVVVLGIGKGLTPAKSFYFEKVVASVGGVNTDGYKITGIKDAYKKDATTIEIPDTFEGRPVLVIGVDFFKELDSEKITTLIIPKNVCQIDALGPSGNGLASIGLEKIDVDEDNRVFCDIDGVLFTKNKKTLLSYPMGKKGTEYTVPEKCSKLGLFAFFAVRNLVTINAENVTDLVSDEDVGLQFLGAIKLENVNMNKVKNVPFGSFMSCGSLKKIDFPLVTSIKDLCFVNCVALEEVNLPSVTHFGQACFQDCTKLKKLTINKPNLAYIDIDAADSDPLQEGLIRLTGNLLYSLMNSLNNFYSFNLGLKHMRQVGAGYTSFDGCAQLDEIVITATVFDDDVKELLQDSVFPADTIDVYFETQALVDAFNSWYAGTKFVAHVSEA